ncbi:cytochrome P450 2J6-like protein [Leptotrombidium deliense]|uniref:Cytochrome P450 2J6-like protein n=1 Tax=Leptotrombidium deliense TaxID=299467 RepID=A0A443S1F7_9ACAR|nr:cytochrome P450 2J6-like protein [Leptotrombidium deliense]
MVVFIFNHIWYKSWLNDNLASNMVNLLTAGSEIVATLIHCGVNLMAQHANVQQRVYEEISDTIGIDGLFYYSDRERMHYTQAVISERRLR